MEMAMACEVWNIAEKYVWEMFTIYLYTIILVLIQ